MPQLRLVRLLVASLTDILSFSVLIRGQENQIGVNHNHRALRDSSTHNLLEWNLNQYDVILGVICIILIESFSIESTTLLYPCMNQVEKYSLSSFQSTAK